MSNQANVESQVNNVVEILKKGLIVIGIGLLGGLGFIGYKNYSNSKQEKAFSELFLAEKIEEAAEKEAGVGQKKADELMREWPEDKRNEYLSKLQKVYEGSKGQAASAMAGLKLGKWYLGAKDYSKAESHFQDMLKAFSASQNPERNIIRVMVIEGLGVAFEETQKWSEAEKFYKEAAEMAENPLKPLSLMGLARAQRKLNKSEEAKQSYEKIYTEFPNTTYEKKARALRALLDQPSSAHVGADSRQEKNKG
jgi:tetratricopeptide (TPR) repeat protein